MTATDTANPAATTLRTSSNAPDSDVSWKVKCLNCGAPLVGPFCAECGQRVVPPHPTVRELAGDAFNEVSGWDGKIAETIRTLLRAPGELTRQWIEGRRARFISPLRLYLATSLVYFLVIAAAPDVRGGTDGGVEFGATKIGTGAPATAPTPLLSGEERDSALASVAQAPAFIQPMLRRAIDDPQAFNNATMKAMPRVFFALVPVFAGFLALFYRGRPFPDHFYFAIHFHAFFFIARTIGNVALFSKSMIFTAVVQGVMLLWIAFYMIAALRRTYGGSVLGTIARALGACALYAVVAAPVILAVSIIVAS